MAGQDGQAQPTGESTSLWSLAVARLPRRGPQNAAPRVLRRCTSLPSQCVPPQSPLITSAHHRASLPTTVSCCPSFQGQRGAAARRARVQQADRALAVESHSQGLWPFEFPSRCCGRLSQFPSPLPNRFGNLFLAFLPSPLHGHRPPTPRCLDQAGRVPLTAASAPHNLRENQREPLPPKSLRRLVQRRVFHLKMSALQTPLSRLFCMCVWVFWPVSHSHNGGGGEYQANNATPPSPVFSNTAAYICLRGCTSRKESSPQSIFILRINLVGAFLGKTPHHT